MERGGCHAGVERDRTSRVRREEARNHYGNIPRTEEVIFKETRPPFQGNFAFPVRFFVLFLRRPESPSLALPLQQDDYENFAPFSGSPSPRGRGLCIARDILSRVNLLDPAFTVDGFLATSVMISP